MTNCDKCNKETERTSFLSPNGDLVLCDKCKDRYDNLMAYYVRCWLSDHIVDPAPGREENQKKPDMPIDIIPDEWIVIQSSGIKEIRYNKNQSLDVKFRSGQIYTYVGVPPGIIAGMLATEYKGEYFNREIKNVYRAGLVS